MVLEVAVEHIQEAFVAEASNVVVARRRSHRGDMALDTALRLGRTQEGTSIFTSVTESGPMQYRVWSM